MGTIIDPGKQPSPAEAAPTREDTGEVLVVDARGEMTPSEMVDQKLRTLLGGDPPDTPPPHPEDFRRCPD